MKPIVQELEPLLEGGRNRDLTGFLREESRREVEGRGASPAHYNIFLVRNTPDLPSEVFGPQRITGGTYSAEDLYGAAGSPLAHFRSTVRTLLARAEAAAVASPGALDYGHHVALFWADIGRLSEFMGASMAISEIVAELRTARFQFLGKDTPVSVLHALRSALRVVADSKRLDAGVVDRVVETLEAGGVDSLAPDALRDGDG